jgi:sialic acid synthase SpsE
MATSTKTKIILETGCNHQGVFENALQVIDDAVKLGVWGIKFQKRDIDSIPKEIAKTTRNSETSFGATYYEHRKALEFSVDQIAAFKKYAEERGLVPIVTVFDIVSLKQMIDAGFEYIKLPSQFYSNYAMNLMLFDEHDRQPVIDNYNNRRNKFKIVVSTGMHTMNEIERWPWFDKADITLYCRSIYPANLDQVDFVTARTLKEKLKHSEFGYSSHDKNGCAIPHMVMFGAKYIERHYTLNKEWKGSDHGTVSSDYEEMQKIIEKIKSAEDMLSKTNDTELVNDEEKKVRLTYRGI